MALFEVFIPTNDTDGFNITARIRADSWIQALKSGLARLGDTADVRNIMCDFTEHGIDVTEPQSGRVFRIKELAEEGMAPPPAAAPPVSVAPPPAAAPPVSVAPPPAAAPPVSAAPPPAAAPPVSAAPPPAAAPPVSAAPPPAAAPPVSVAPPPAAAPPVTRPRFVAEVQEESVTQQRASEVPAQRIGRGQQQTSRPVEDLFEELFSQAQGVYDQSDLRASAAYLLDLGMRVVPSDSGAVFIADIDSNELWFAAARGPKAQEVLEFRVPMGAGIVGFCCQEGVSLAVSDVHRHPAFYAKISQSLGYETRSILCSPSQSDGRVFAALELINKSSGSSFTGDEVNLLNYLAHEFADYLINTGQTGH